MRIIALLCLFTTISLSCSAAAHQSYHIRRSARINQLENSYMTFHDRSRLAFLAGDHVMARYYDQRCIALWNVIVHFRSVSPTLSSGVPVSRES
jgi:hypothetical protein